MRNIIFILFILINVGLFQSYRCIRNIGNEHIVQSINHDEFTAASANQIDDDTDHEMPSQKKKRKRLRISPDNFDLQPQTFTLISQFVKTKNSFLPEATYKFQRIYCHHKRGPPVHHS